MAGAQGTVGRTLLGELHILDEAMQGVPAGTIGTVWFKLGSQFQYFHDPEGTKAALSPTALWGRSATSGTSMGTAIST
jgi:long-chain acyl-CoA synthetase